MVYMRWHRMTRVILVWLLCSFGLVACNGGTAGVSQTGNATANTNPNTGSGPNGPTSALEPGNIALLNGRIYTVDEQSSWAQAVVVKQGEIVYVGDSDQAQSFIDDTVEVIDLAGKLVLPGIHDTHMHPLEAGSDQVTCMLDVEQSLSEMVDVVRQCSQDSQTTGWLLGWGHTLETLLDSAVDPRQLLDAINSERPIAIMEATSHSVWVNSKALALAGIDNDTPDPVGGAILRNSAGRSTGILLDSAGDKVFGIAFLPTAQLRQANYEGLLYGLQQVAKNGITSIVDARVYWQRDYLQAWHRANEQGTLTARTVLSLWAYPSLSDEQQLATLKSMYNNDPDSLLRVSQIKLYSDGILHNATAALLQPYVSYFDQVGPTGLNYFSAERLARYVTELEKVGFDMQIHAIGDRGVRESLDAIAMAQQLNQGQGQVGRHKITHLEMISQVDKSRFAKLGVVADFQVAGDFTHPDNFSEVEPLIGERAYQMLPLRDIYDSGAKVTLSSDWDVSSLSPFVGMANALNRAEQSLPNLDAVIRAYTINGAYVMRQEQRTGSIELGKYGDLVIVDRDLFNINSDQISQTKVLMTILAGKVVYDRSKL